MVAKLAFWEAASSSAAAEEEEVVHLLPLGREAVSTRGAGALTGTSRHRLASLCLPFPPDTSSRSTARASSELATKALLSALCTSSHQDGYRSVLTNDPSSA